jgi:hypothetical protein
MSLCVGRKKKKMSVVYTARASDAFALLTFRICTIENSFGPKVDVHIEPQSLQQHGNSKSGNFSALESYTTYQIRLVLLSLSLYVTSYSSAWTSSGQVYFPAALTLLCGEIGGGDTTSFRHVQNFALG